PWSAQEPPFGFGTGTPWLPQPPDWKNLTVESQQADQNSMLALYRNALTIRRDHLGDGSLTWLESDPGVLSFQRESLTSVTNLTPEPIDLPPYQDLLLTSTPLDNGQLPPDTTAWLR
ncbi:alpha-glucosidase, partial [Kribbella albertanoniae]